MSRHIDRAMELRRRLTPDGRPVYNCCQAVVAAFAGDIGLDEETSLKLAAHFGGGMRMGSVCGAITGGLMVLGLSGVDDAGAANELYRRVRGAHEGMVNCKDLLRANAERGGVKLDHCNGMIGECIGYVEDILRGRGKPE